MSVESFARDDDAVVLTRMTSAIAHHLRNPLAGIGGALHVLRDRANLSGDEKAIFDEIIGRLRQVDQSIEDLVDLARPFEPRLNSFSLSQVVHHAVSDLQRDGIDDLLVEVEGSADQQELSGDPALVRRALYHLLRNCVEAGGCRGEPVAVELRQDDETWSIDVVDRGSGWSVGARARMFEPFFTTKSRHLGLGLFVARRMVAAQGGELACTRTDEHGTVMTLSLPRC